MEGERVAVYDTTLRDGTQAEGISLSVEDKLKITQLLDELGVDYIEGGWPGSNPKDAAYFQRVRDLPLTHAKIAAFGSTCRVGSNPAEDANIQAMKLRDEGKVEEAQKMLSHNAVMVQGYNKDLKSEKLSRIQKENSSQVEQVKSPRWSFFRM